MTDREILKLAMKYPFVSAKDAAEAAMFLDPEDVSTSIHLGNVFRVWDHMYSRWRNYVSGHNAGPWQLLADTFRYGLQCALEDALRLYPELADKSPLLEEYMRSVQAEACVHARSWAQAEEVIYETQAVMPVAEWQDIFYNVPDYGVWSVCEIRPGLTGPVVRLCLDCEWNYCPPLLVMEREFPVDPDTIDVEYFIKAQCVGR